MRLLELLNHIDQIRRERLYSISITNHRLLAESLPPKSSMGFYWIYTSYSFEELHQSTNSLIKGAVDIPYLVGTQGDLNYVIKQGESDFTVVYNGIGGCGRKGHGGLRERILEEFRGGKGTGSLAIKHTNVNNLEKWRFSYVIVECPTNPELVDVPLQYDSSARTIERGWRLQYGWPVLCKQ